MENRRHWNADYGTIFVLGFIVSFWSEEIMGFIILPAVFVGLGFMLYGQIKYNKGIFRNENLNLVR